MDGSFLFYSASSYCVLGFEVLRIFRWRREEAFCICTEEKFVPVPP